VVVALALGALAASAVGVPTASADTGSDQAELAHLSAALREDGEQVQRDVARYNAAQARVAHVQSQLAAVEQELVGSEESKSTATTRVKQLAIDLYMDGGVEPSVSAYFEDPITEATRQVYADTVGANFRDDIDAFNAATVESERAQSDLRTDQEEALKGEQGAAAAQLTAESILDRDDASFDSVQANLRASVAAAIAQTEAEEREEEEGELANEESATPPGSVAIVALPGTYGNPLRAISALDRERVDQGVDYSGYGPMFALGDGVVLSTTNSGWPGGTFIAYRLVDGPAPGLVVYAAEDLLPRVSTGERVTADTIIGSMYEGPDGIETGWADPSGDGVTMAADARQFDGSNSTAFGANFSQLLASVGAPPGVMQNEPATGQLPAGWPSW